jgi:hypothetical protein
MRSAARARLTQIEAAEARAAVAPEDFERGLARAYREPAAARTAFPKAVTREREAREALRRHPEKGLLEREIGRAMRQLLPREMEELRRLVSSPQFALAAKLREVAKDAVLGRDGCER